MAAYVLAQADRLGDKNALKVISPGVVEIWTYARLKAAILGTATGLLNSGLSPGDRLLMRLGNSVDFPIVYLASIAVGIVPVPTSSQLKASEIAAIATQVKPDMIVAAPGIACPGDQNIATLDLGSLRAMRDMPQADPVCGDPNRPAYIAFTSGTSGQPRGVIHAHRAVWARRMMWDGWYRLTEKDHLMHAGAFNWTYTMGTGLMDPWAIGATALIPADGVGSEQLPALMEKHNVSIFAAAPGVYRQLLRAKMPALPALRHGLSAGEKLPEKTRDEWQLATGSQIFEAFGMSECSTFISSDPRRPVSGYALGFAQPGRQVAIVGDTGIAKLGVPGVIAISGKDAGLMLGYADGAVAPHDDWFLTGDIGSMAKNGAIQYLGRNDDMMNAGGYRVSPLEVETAMLLHGAILECAAVEIAKRENLSLIALAYRAKNPIDHGELAEHAAKHLARYKQPRIFRHVSELPTGANGKVQRKHLRQPELWEFLPGS